MLFPVSPTSILRLGTQGQGHRFTGMRDQLRRRAYEQKGAASQVSTGALRRLSPQRMNPESYSTMTQVRAGVDNLDRQIVALLAQRFAHMRAAARIKPDRSAVRDEARKAQVIANACAEAEALGVPCDLIAGMWEELVEASIAYEMAEFDRTRD